MSKKVGAPAYPRFAERTEKLRLMYKKFRISANIIHRSGAFNFTIGTMRNKINSVVGWKDEDELKAVEAAFKKVVANIEK